MATWSRLISVGELLPILLLTVSGRKRPCNFESDSGVGRDFSGGVPRLTCNQEPSDIDIELTLATLDRIRRLRNE
jgi:hypothetical protein